MGAELNPRLGILDFKMFYEVRIPGTFFSSSAVLPPLGSMRIMDMSRPEALFLVMAHFLYANACSKEEELIITSWLVHLISI